MKVLALYLPQFYTTPENDEWWGEGFTDWVSSQNGKPLFEGHIQPHVPLNGNTYNLLEKKTMEWQANLLHKYDIDGFCMYHYWFADSRKMLEKPAENLLSWQDIDMPFCFCWANESWTRTWDRVLGGNVWYSVNSKVINGRKVLLEQKYGDKKEWKDHFDYLLPFFKDSRYIRINGRPVFYIYKPADIICFSDMKAYWDQLADLNGIPHVLFVGGYQNNADLSDYDYSVYHTPLVVQQNVKADKISDVRVIDYEMATKYIVLKEPEFERCGFMSFVGYDDTPRHRTRGTVYVNRTPEGFRTQLTEVMAKNESLGIPFTMINAWNEWGEGMHLEPDEADGYSYLEQIAPAKKDYLQRVDSLETKIKSYFNDVSEMILPTAKRKTKEEIYLDLLDMWLTVKEQGRSLEEFFKKRNYKLVCIYGMGILGEHLYEELRKSDVIKVEYIVDRDTSRQYPIDHYMPEDDLPKVDAMIVTAVISFPELYKKYKELNDGRIISIVEVIKESI